MNGESMVRPALRLTVFTIAHETASDCRDVLKSLQRQSIRDAMEVIIVAPNRDGLADDCLDEFGAGRWILLPEVRSCGEPMAAATRAAQAPFVAYAEEHSTLREDWAENLVAAHEAGYDAVGFAMENANPDSVVSWAHLYGQFGPVVAPVESAETDFLAGHHVSYRKQMLLDDYDDMLRDVLEDESALFLDLRARGRKMYVAGDAVSFHVNISSLKAYMHLDFLGQRSFAAARARVARWSPWRRIFYACAGPLIPFVRLRRIFTHIRRTGRGKELLPEILVPLLLGLSSGAVGESVGYLFGGGRSAEQKAPAELQRELFLSKKDRRARQPA